MTDQTGQIAPRDVVVDIWSDPELLMPWPEPELEGRPMTYWWFVGLLALWAAAVIFAIFVQHA